LRGRSVADWLREMPPATAALLEALVRLTTYALAPGQQDAGAALRQLQLGQHGVLYLDGGWQTLVDGSRAAAEQAHVRCVARAAVRAVEVDSRVRGVVFESGER